MMFGWAFIGLLSIHTLPPITETVADEIDTYFARRRAVETLRATACVCFECDAAEVELVCHPLDDGDTDGPE